MRTIKVLLALFILMTAGCSDPYKKGKNLVRDGEYEKAAKFFLELTEKRPDDPRAYNELGYAYTRLKMRDEAIKAYKKAIELKPDYYLAEFNLGTVFFYKADIDNCIEHMERAIEINPQCEECHLSAGICWFQADKMDKAERHIDRAIEISGGKNNHEDYKNIIKERREELEELTKEKEAPNNVEPSGEPTTDMAPE